MTSLTPSIDLQRWPRLAQALSRLSSLSFPKARIRFFMILLALALFAFQGAGIFYRILGIEWIVPKRDMVIKPTVPAVPSLSREPATAYQPIVERNLLGSTDRAFGDKQAEAAPQAPPLSSLVELRGTVAGEGKYGFAVFSEKGKPKQVLVKVGGQIAGAQLLRVLRDQVVFRYLDKEETLKRSTAPQSSLAGSSSAPAPPSSGPPSGPGPYTISRSEIGTSMKDMGQMLSQAQIRPYFAGGVQEGFMVSQIRPGSIFQRLGLRDGDIIQGFDSRKVQSADDFMALHNAFQSATNMNLSIKRAGKVENLQYQFR